MQQFTTEKRDTVKQTEINLCAISSLFSEARRIEANIRNVAARSTASFWKLAPQAHLRSAYQYVKGFAAYLPVNMDGASESLGEEAALRDEWHFQFSGFPHTLVQQIGRTERLPLFYEQTMPRGIGSEGIEINARAFIVNGDEVVEVASLNKLRNEDLRLALNPDVELYTIHPRSNFTYDVVQVPFFPTVDEMAPYRR
jgi:hypothetical protein